MACKLTDKPYLTMKIEQPSDNTLYITIGGYVYYFDASIEGEYLVERWSPEDDKDNYATETLQFTEDEPCQ